VTVGVLGRLMRGLVDVSGQHEHVGLFDVSTHREILDRFAGLEQRVEEYRKELGHLRAIEANLAELGGNAGAASERVELLHHQLQEILGLSPAPREDVELEEERRRLMAAEKLRSACEEAHERIAGQEHAATQLVGRAAALLSDAARIDVRLASVSERVATASAELDEGARGLARYLARPEGEPARLAELTERLDALKRLCRKHGTDLAGLLRRREEMLAELALLEDRIGELAALEEDRDGAEAACRDRAQVLSALRRSAATGFSSKVESVLASLALPKAKVEVRVAEQATLGPGGADEVELLFAANTGDPPRALAKVASGGEASRLLLALKSVLAGSDQCGCYVLDEADAGVSGAVAEVVGRMIKEVSAHRQGLCITHLPQVAVYADHHLSIRKRQRSDGVVSRVVALEDEGERTRELARMLAGVELTPEAIGAAQALVRSAARVPRGGRGRGRERRTA
jgi:DNA repair protein RecN (Recombination protein N)